MAESGSTSGSPYGTTLSESIENPLPFLAPAQPMCGTLGPVLQLSPPSFAEGINRARHLPARTKRSGYRIIGRGTVGTVFEIPGSELAVKKGPNIDVLWNDFRLTNKVNRSFAKSKAIL